MRFLAVAGALLLLNANIFPASADDAADIRQRLETWARDFNERRVDAACDLFSKDLVSDAQGQGEAGYTERCRILTKVMNDPDRTFSYHPDIKEILVEGKLAIVRLEWTLAVSPGDETSTETGLDVFRKEEDGVWRIFRFMAFDNP